MDNIVQKASAYIDEHIPRSLISFTSLYDQKTKRLIVSYIGEWPQDEQDSLRHTLFEKFEVEVDFQEAL